MNKHEAKDLGLLKYDPGKPCKNGHDSLRHTSNGGCVACMNASNKTIHPDVHTNYKLKRKYGITLEDYDRMLEEQDGKCAICFTTEPGLGRFSVDHCHDSGEVRGLLCNTCNRGIGLLGDDIDILLSAASYLAAKR